MLLVSILALRFSYSPPDLRDHAFGIIGAALMLQTELTYTWRKREFIRAGSRKRWLQVHIFTGLLGPALILWHAGFTLYGFAGAVTYLTILVMLSGVFGRYIYRSIPRTLLGEERTLEDIVEEQKNLEADLRLLLADKPRALNEIFNLEILTARGSGFGALVRAAIDYYRARYRIHRYVADLSGRQFAAYKQLEETALKRLSLERRVIVLENSRRILANWRGIHQPLTLTLFYAIGLHILTAIYYGRGI